MTEFGLKQKLRFKIGILPIFIFFLSACGIWVNESPLPKHPPEISTEATSRNEKCQIDFAELKTSFFSGKLTAHRVQTVLQCAIDIVHQANQTIVPNTPGILTHKEIKVLMTSNILGSSETLGIWVDRILSLRDILVGHDPKGIRFSQLVEILTRIQRSDLEVETLSKLYEKYEKETSKTSTYWELRKQVFSQFMKIFKTLLQDPAQTDHYILKDTILKQYHLWEGLEAEVGSHYIQAGFIANRVLFGRSDGSVLASNLRDMLNHLEKIFIYVCDINSLLELDTWRSDQSISFLYAYEQLLEYLFQVFQISPPEELQKTDLIALLEMLHKDRGGKALEFVDAIMAFKSRVFGGDENRLTKEHLQKMISSFKKSIHAYDQSIALFKEDQKSISKEYLRKWLLKRQHDLEKETFHHYFLLFENFDQFKYLWMTPFTHTDTVSKHNFLLSQVVFPFVTEIITAYDTDQDGKLSFGMGQEVQHEGLVSLISTIQKGIRGLDQLLDPKSQAESTPQNPSDLTHADPLTLSQFAVVLSDQLLTTSNADQFIDAYELLEATSFILENSRTVKWFVEDPLIQHFQVERTQKEDEKQLKREGLVDTLKEVSTLHWYFPTAMQQLTQEEIQQSMAYMISAVGRKDPSLITLSELESIFVLFRFTEIIFLRFDANKDGWLEKSEVRSLYRQLEPFLNHLTTSYQNDPDSITKHRYFGKVSKYFIKIFQNFFYPVFSKERIQRKVFEFSIRKGRLPSGISDLYHAMIIDKPPRANRVQFIKLLTELYKQL